MQLISLFFLETLVEFTNDSKKLQVEAVKVGELGFSFSIDLHEPWELEQMAFLSLFPMSEGTSTLTFSVNIPEVVIQVVGRDGSGKTWNQG